MRNFSGRMVFHRPSPIAIRTAHHSLRDRSLSLDYQLHNAQYFETTGQRSTLDLFHQASRYIPAYRNFLHQHHIEPSKVKTIADFKLVPAVTKNNYLKQYPLAELCWNGKLESCYILSSSSGSSGKPFLWPRGAGQEEEGASQHEAIFKEFFHVDVKKTLYINCFAMGTWIAGTFVLASIERLTQKGYPILSITPGIEKDVVLSLWRELSGQFDQVIFGGYPPFIKDVLDAGKNKGIKWNNYKIKFLFAAEGFSETWRAHIHQLVGTTDQLSTSINCYGSADAALLAHETPTTIAIRQFASAAWERNQELFGDNRLPTLAQYDPRLRYFETEGDHLLFTARSGIPLIRYTIGDEGQAVPYLAMKAKLSRMGYEMEVVARKHQHVPWQLPFVYLFGRSDLTVSLYGLLIYPEHIKYGLEIASLAKWLTGKFVMSIEYDKQQNPYLLIRVEMVNGVAASSELAHKAQQAVIQGLKKANSEYHRLRQELGEKATPRIELISQGNTEYFKQGAKQRWVERN